MLEFEKNSKKLARGGNQDSKGAKAFEPIR
jgi:hypothetical protein